MNQTLTAEIATKIDRYLKQAVDRTSASAVYVTDRGGYMIGQRTAQEFPMEDNLVALIAGAFFASQQAAHLLGEEEFNSMIEKGKNKSIFVRVLEGDHLFISIFGKETNSGLVKLFADEIAGGLNEVVSELQSGASSQAMHSFEMDDSAPVFQINR